MTSNHYIGTAAWNIPKTYAEGFSPDGSHLMRYAGVLNAVEINSSFYKEHKASTYKKWASDVPTDFRFSVKLSKVFTHESKLLPVESDLMESLERIIQLEEKLGVLLVQLPGKQDFEQGSMKRFYQLLRNKISCHIVLESRNLSWGSPDSMNLMKEFGISKVIADPEKCPWAAKNINIIDYYRLHGSPLIYKSNYTEQFLSDLSVKMKSVGNSWCIFDNTTFGHATGNALKLKEQIYPA